MGKLKEYEINNIPYDRPLYDDNYVDGSLDYLYGQKSKIKCKKVKKTLAIAKKVVIIDTKEKRK